MHLIEDLEKNYRVDPHRIYVTGLSMGGYGTWDLATKYPGKFAAIAPICGGGKAWLAARKLNHLPIWVFHGAKDQAVPFAESQEMVDALRNQGNTAVKFTVYPEAGHDSWTESYDNQDLYTWLLSTKGSSPRHPTITGLPSGGTMIRSATPPAFAAVSRRCNGSCIISLPNGKCP